eukprot:CAMPEP_0167763702 /NCGR_PEP_ID=MMETSP0110_2-20121227/13546_1 /TAXON_ID=629695 /ORGANISM="Gymnochlora sp., Strain CCMP2014" /LENGTH=709 /DNA_ID=CAMNT_0007650869 /DNA_START=224 /DNA_END=2353 /DNA_ORIENTATION=+
MAPMRATGSVVEQRSPDYFTGTSIEEFSSKLSESDRSMLQALRGSSLNVEDKAASDKLLVVEVSDDEKQKDKTDRLPQVYDSNAIAKYWQKRPAQVVKRLWQVASSFAGLFARVGTDLAFDRLSQTEPDRIRELREVIVSLGPFYIKFGQALAIRPDIVSPNSMIELQKLCDKVPAYDNKIAMDTIRKELGGEIDEFFSEITPDCVAAASLGQVYKATLRESGDIVAVKVQRPFVLETVSLDLYLGRLLGEFAKKVGVRTDVVALVDEFAQGIYRELDFRLECEAGIQIAKDLEHIPNVIVPKCYPRYTARRVHVAQWVEGEKLSQSQANDVNELVNLGVIAYLTQLLDTGLFHADPHPGNLIRTPDGKLCLLDFGLMTRITDEQKYAMVDSILHLSRRDYTRIGDDFKALGFIPEEYDPQPLLPALTRVFDAALAGGGAKSINFNELSSDLAEITYEFPFRIPPFFALIIRAIGVLEGIALVGDPKFAIIDSAYPYIANRLLTDESPRVKAALKYMLYGPNGKFDVQQTVDLLQNLEAFSKELNMGRDPNEDPANDNEPGRERNTATNRAIREALLFVFSDKGKIIRDFLLEEVVSSVEALSTDALYQLSVRLNINQNLLPPIARVFVHKLDDQEQQTVDNIVKLVEFISGDLSRGTTPQVLQEVVPLLPTALPVMQDFSVKVVSLLAERTTAKLIRGLFVPGSVAKP